MTYSSIDAASYNFLQERFSRTPSHNIADIYDGESYKKHSDFLCQPTNVSLTLNTDGVALYRSSKVSLWPVWFIVNELPKRMR